MPCVVHFPVSQSRLFKGGHPKKVIKGMTIQQGTVGVYKDTFVIDSRILFLAELLLQGLRHMTVKPQVPSPVLVLERRDPPRGYAPPYLENVLPAVPIGFPEGDLLARHQPGLDRELEIRLKPLADTRQKYLPFLPVKR